jgi:hypothetical protein
MNTLDVGKNEHGNITITVRSDAERDQSAVIQDPAAHILTVATLAGIAITMSGTAAETQKVASGEKVIADEPPGAIET